MVISSADFVLGPGEKICPRREREAGTRVHTTGAVSFVQITVFGNWTPLKAALGAEASPLPWWLCRVFLILSQSQETKPTKQKDSNARFVQVHTCHVFIGIHLILSRKKKLKAGWWRGGFPHGWLVKSLRNLLKCMLLSTAYICEILKIYLKLAECEIWFWGDSNFVNHSKIGQ